MVFQTCLFDVELRDFGLNFGDEVGALSEKNQENTISPQGLVGQFIQGFEFDSGDFVKHGSQLRNAVGFHLRTFDPDCFGQECVEFVLLDQHAPFRVFLLNAFPSVP